MRDQITTYVEQVFDSTVGVEESRPHGTVNICSRESHALHIRDRCHALSTKRKR